MHDTLPSATPQSISAAGNPFRYSAFRVIWIATVVSNIGGWMYNVACGWFMTSLDSNPLSVALVQVANSLPMFLFAIPAGALADIVNQRRFLIFGEFSIMVASTAFATLVWLRLITPHGLLAFSFVVAVGSAMTAPAWQSVVAELVPRPDLPAAVAANSVGINLSRAIGPALGGVLVAGFGIAAPFWVDAFSNIGVIGALIWWRAPKTTDSPLPAESFTNAVRTGLRYVRYNAYLRATLIRAVAFFLFASAYWALLPLIVRSQLSGSPTLYGVLLGAIGAAAVGGAFLLRWLRLHFGVDWLVAGASVSTAVAMALFALAREPAMAIVASLIAGVSWIAAVSSLNVSAQFALPEWVRGRGLAVYVTIMFGALTAGSAIWGQLAAFVGLRASLLVASAGALVAIGMTWRWKLQAGAQVDLSPSLHWPDPVTTHPIESDRGPVLVMVEYRIDLHCRDAFLKALREYSRERRRDGAYDWAVFEDPADGGRFVETFLTDSWLEHLRQHRRVTQADRISEQAVRRFQVGGPPKTTHLISAKEN